MKDLLDGLADSAGQATLQRALLTPLREGKVNINPVHYIRKTDHALLE